MKIYFQPRVTFCIFKVLRKTFLLLYWFRFIIRVFRFQRKTIVIPRALLDVFDRFLSARFLGNGWTDFPKNFRSDFLSCGNDTLLNRFDGVPSDFEKLAISCVLEGLIVTASSQKPLHIKIWNFWIRKINVCGCACTNSFSLFLNGY